MASAKKPASTQAPILPSGDGAASPYTAPTATRSRNMAAVKRTNTKPEVQLRRALHAAGYRYRKDLPIRIGGKLVRPDIAFTRRLRAGVRGCWATGHVPRRHSITPGWHRRVVSASG